MILLPTYQEQSAIFLYQANIENQVVVLRFVYNIRSGCFSVYITDGNGNQVNSIKVVPNWPLLKFRKSFTDIRGDFFVFNDTRPDDKVITYDNFGNGFNLYYLTQDEVEAWEQANGI